MARAEQITGSHVIQLQITNINVIKITNYFFEIRGQITNYKLRNFKLLQLNISWNCWSCFPI